jgi:hypothetical protein
VCGSSSSLKEIQIVFELLEFDEHCDLLVLERLAQPVPEVALPQLPSTVGQAGIEDQAQGVQEVALADAVFADDDCIAVERDVDLAKVAKVADVYPCELHDPSQPVILAAPIRHGAGQDGRRHRSQTCNPLRRW